MSSTIKIKVVQVFRKSSPYFFSIENVFSTVQPFLTNIALSIVRAERQGVRISNLFQMGKLRKYFDLFHVTGDIHYAVFAFPGNKVILTIHDCVFLKNYSGIKKWVLKKILLEWPVRHAKIITTISEKSKAEILMYSQCDPAKVRVIPNPVQSIFKYAEMEFNAQRPRILFLGKTPNKNLDRVIEALKDFTCLLNIVGVATAEQYKALEENKINFIIESGLTENEMVHRYELCDIVLFPSWYEGFGLPIIESFQTGRVVITSNISPMREVADGGAFLVDPYDINSIREGVIKVTRDEILRSKLIKRGSVVVKGYQASHIAKLYENLYLELASES